MQAPPNSRVGGWFRTDTPYGLNEAVNADTLIVPACHSVHEAPPPDLVEVVRAAHAKGARIASICSGAFVLAAVVVLRLARRRCCSVFMIVSCSLEGRFWWGRSSSDDR